METEGQKNQPPHRTINFEKRKHPKFSVDLPVEYYKIGSPVQHNGRAMNASQGGLLLYFSEPLQIGQYLRLKLFLSSHSTWNAVETIAVVVWTDIPLDESWEYYRTGVRFIDISQENMSKLKTFLFHLSK